MLFFLHLFQYITNSTLSYFLSGKTTPYLYTLLQICDALEVLPQEIVEKRQNKQQIREEMYGAAGAFDMDKMSKKYHYFNEKQKILLELFIEALEQTLKC